MLREVYINIKNTNDVKLFDVVDIDLNELTESFSYWNRSHERWIMYDDYVGLYPQCHLRYVTPNTYKITFKFYGYNELIESMTYQLSRESVKHILNNLLNNLNYRHRL